MSSTPEMTFDVEVQRRTQTEWSPWDDAKPPRAGDLIRLTRDGKVDAVYRVGDKPAFDDPVLSALVGWEDD